MKSQEIEVKLSLTQQEYIKLLKFFKSEQKPHYQWNYYFDIPLKKGFLLKNIGCTLRARKKKNQHFITFKSRTKKNSQRISIQDEYEFLISKNTFNQIIYKNKYLQEVPNPKLQKVLNIIGQKISFSSMPRTSINALQYLSKNKTKRTPIPFKINKSKLTIELDKTIYKISGKNYIHFELELEIPSKLIQLSIDKLQLIFNQLQIPWRPSSFGKSTIALQGLESSKFIPQLIKKGILKSL